MSTQPHFYNAAVLARVKVGMTMMQHTEGTVGFYKQDGSLREMDYIMADQSSDATGCRSGMPYVLVVDRQLGEYRYVNLDKVVWLKRSNSVYFIE